MSGGRGTKWVRKNYHFNIDVLCMVAGHKDEK